MKFEAHLPTYYEIWMFGVSGVCIFPINDIFGRWGQNLVLIREKWYYWLKFEKNRRSGLPAAIFIVYRVKSQKAPTIIMSNVRGFFLVVNVFTIFSPRNPITVAPLTTRSVPVLSIAIYISQSFLFSTLLCAICRLVNRASSSERRQEYCEFRVRTRYLL